MNTKRSTEALEIAQKAIKSFNYAIANGDAPDPSDPMHRVILGLNVLAEAYIAQSADVERLRSALQKAKKDLNLVIGRSTRIEDGKQIVEGFYGCKCLEIFDSLDAALNGESTESNSDARN